MSAIQEQADGVLLTVRVIPRASRSEVRDEREGVLTIRLKAPPVEGKANKALAKLLAEVLGVRARQVTVRTGATSRNKRVHVAGVTRAAAERALT